MSNLFFRDLSCDGCLEGGLEYLTSGIVESKHFDDKPSVSGKDYSVVYISPFGIVEREWRAEAEIKIYEVDACDFENLKTAIYQLEKAQTE